MGEKRVRVMALTSRTHTRTYPYKYLGWVKTFLDIVLELLERC